MTDWADDRAHEWLGDNIGDYRESEYWRDRCDSLAAELRAAYERGVRDAAKDMAHRHGCLGCPMVDGKCPHCGNCEGP